MAEIVVFQSRRELGARANMERFIQLAREDLRVFGDDLDFGAMTWDLSGHIHLKARSNAVRAVFSSWETRNDRTPSPMPEPYLSFAKAFFRYQHGMRPTKAISQRLAALRSIAAALNEQGTADTTRIDSGTLNRAAQYIVNEFVAENAYRVGVQLEMIAEFLDANTLCHVPIQWKNTIPRPAAADIRVGEEFDARREEKLPSADELDALARAYRAAEDPRDVVLTSIAALLCSTPDRINEVLRLRVDCDLKDERHGQQQRYGLRYWPSKGADPMIKWVIPSMVSLVEEALQRIRKHTDAARSVAAWYEAHPNSLYLPAHLEHFRGSSEITMAELSEMLFVIPAKGAGVSWCKQNKIPTSSQGHKLTVSFSDVERALLKNLPKGFPIFDPDTELKYSQALCLTRRNFFHGRRGVYWSLIDPISIGAISTGLGNRTAYGFQSVFERLGFQDADGSPIAIRTHQFRHYLNTLAQQGGLSELDIAKWSGRATTRDNSAYNHVSDRDIQARIADLRSDGDGTSTQLAVNPRVSLIPRAKFKELNISAAHTTDFGFCAHDFAMSPCQLHMDCMNCNEQVCIKGDEVGEANARMRLEETRNLLLEAEAADRDGIYGASRWVEHQKLTMQRLEQLVSIFDNPSVPRGAVIRLSHVKPASRLQQAAEARKALSGSGEVNERLTWQVDSKAENE